MEDRILLAGPCVIEGEQWLVDHAGKIAEAIPEGWDWYFKASFDKANRTRFDSFRGIGHYPGLRALQRVKDEIGCKLITDIHDSHQIRETAAVVDAIQIPAFLSRQTDLIADAASTNLPINVKIGQWACPYEAEPYVEKGATWLTYRGTFFGYHNLVVDMAAFGEINGYCPSIFDCTHSTAGNRWKVPALTHAAIAARAQGLFMEVHPNPKEAKCDADCQISVANMKALLEGISV